MADNLTTTTTVSTIPSGSVIATDDAGAGGHVQIVKLAVSTDGSATALTADNTNGLLVNLGSNNDVTLATLPDTAAGDLAAINTAVSGTLTVGSHAVTNAGTFAVQVDGAALTALQLIDNAIYTDDVPFTAGSNAIMAAGFRFDDVVPDGVTEGDIGYARMSSNRNLYVQLRDAAGNERGLNIDASGQIAVTNAGTFAVQAAQSGTWTVDLGANNDVTIDNSSIVHLEDVAHVTGDAGFMALAVQQTADAALAGTTGDYAPLQVDENGYLKVNIKSGAGTGGTSSTDDGAFTAGVGTGTPVMGFATSDVVDAGDVGVLAMDTSRNLKVSIEVDNVGIGGGTQYAVDTALGATPTGTLAVAIRDDALSALTPVEGDAIGLRVDANGALWTIPSGTVTIQEAAALDVSAATVTVDLGANNDVINTGTFAVQEDGAALTALQLIDDTVATLGTTTYTEATSKGNIIGAVRNDTLAALANLDNEIAPLQVNASGALYIQEGAALDVSAATVPTNWNGTAPPIGAGTEAAALRVTLATDSTGLVSVDDNGGALTVDWNGTAPPIGAGLEATALRVTVATDSTGVLSIDDNAGSLTVDNAGTFAVQVDGDALTALQLIDNSIYVDDADWTADTSSHTLVGAVTQATPSANTDGDTTPLITNALRELRLAALESDLAAAGTAHVHKYFTGATPTDGIIWSPAAGKRWYVTHLSINVSAASTVTIEDDKVGGDDPVYKAEFAANSGVVLTFPDVPLFSGEDAADLTVTASAGTVYVTAVGYEI